MPLINDLLGTLPSGAIVPLSDDHLTRYLRENYIQNRVEKARRKHTRKRVDLYKDRGEPYFEEMIDDKFKNLKNRAERKKFVSLAMYQNLTRRVVREVSAVYSEPARRLISSPAMNARYKELQSTLHMDRRMRLANQMVNLCNEAVLWFDLTPSGKPTIRVVTPDNFWAVCHPNDPTELVALIFDRAEAAGTAPSPTTPRYLVLTDDEFFALNSDVQLIRGLRRPHGLERMPAILVHRNEPDATLLEAEPGKDMIAAHMALGLVNIMLLKHQKSGTKQAVAAGDLGDMPVGQQMDEEHILNAPEGVVMSTLDLGADPNSYIATARSIIKQLAANWGIPESVFDLSYQATSGFEIELKRASLKEIRQDQIVDWRPVEAELAEIMVMTLAEAGHGLAFNLGGWALDFGEVGVPREPMARIQYWTELQRLGLMNRVQMYMQLNPESSEDQAIEHILSNIDITALMVEKQRALNISPSTPADGSDQDQDDSDEEGED